MRFAQSRHSDFTLQFAQLPLFIRTCVFFKVNSSSEIDKIYGMHKPFHSCCLTNFLTVAELPSKVKSNMIPPDILITFSVTRMLQFASPSPLRPCILFEIDGSKTYRGGGCELQKTKENKRKQKKYIYIYCLGKACKTKVRLTMHEPLREARGKKGRGESREQGGGGKNPTEEIFTNVTYGYIVMLLMLLTFPHSLNSERSSY